jgi:ankyrin repeat protein
MDVFECARRGNMSGLRSSNNTRAHDPQGRTTLHWACDEGHTAVVKFLLSDKADANAGDHWGSTALHWTTVRGFVDCVKALIKGGADVRAADHNGGTPLHCAACHGRTACAVALLQAAAIPDSVNNFGKTPLADALHFGHEGVAKALLDCGAQLARVHQDVCVPEWARTYVLQEAAGGVAIPQKALGKTSADSESQLTSSDDGGVIAAHLQSQPEDHTGLA